MDSLSHQHYSDYILSKALLQELPTSMTSSDGSGCSESGMYGDFSNNIGAFSCMVPPEYASADISSTTISMAALTVPDRQLGVSWGHVRDALLDSYRRSLFSMNAGIKEGFASNYHPNIYNEVGEECSSAVLDSNFWPVHPIISGDNNNWEIQQGGNNGMAQRPEESTLKIARYSAEERKGRILRYLKKRSQRNFNKTIKYACRKTLADKRVRVRGRFARNNELSDDDRALVVKTNTDHLVNLQQVVEQSCYTTNDPPLLQMNASSSGEEEWLQEVIANLIYYRVLPVDVYLNGASA